MKERFKLVLRPLFLYLSAYFVKPILILIYLLKDRHSAFTDAKFVFVVFVSPVNNEKAVK